ncbi:MAG: hypothetical protein LBJ10_08150 [Clostridiales bacterium]|nr:hypothetical protein [Clostridiales bacterium]
MERELDWEELGWEEELRRRLDAADYRGECKINEAWRPMALALAARHGALAGVPVGQILFVDRQEAKPTKNCKAVLAKAGRIPSRFAEIIFQLTGRSFRFTIEFFKANARHLSREQNVMLLYHEMRHIQAVELGGGESGVAIVGHDVEEWAEVLRLAGQGWDGPHRSVPDLLGAGFDWDGIEGPQQRLPLDQPLRAVK